MATDRMLTVAAAAYDERAAATDTALRQLSIDTPTSEGVDTDLRWVLIIKTARHAGHADVTTGE